MLKIEDIAEDQFLFCLTGECVVIDKKDYKKLSKYIWYFNKTNGYVTTSINNKTIQIGRFILDIDDSKLYVDHKDRNKLNCKRNNLRILTSAQSAVNRKSPSNKKTSRFKGVYWHSTRQKWYARIHVNGKTISLGLHNFEICAAVAYRLKAKQLFGELVCLK